MHGATILECSILACAVYIMINALYPLSYYALTSTCTALYSPAWLVTILHLYHSACNCVHTTILILIHSYSKMLYQYSQEYIFLLPYSRKFWRGIKFGGLAVCLCNHQIKICQYFLLAYICMAIPYWTTKFKSANIFAMAILGPTGKLNSCQYFRLYGIYSWYSKF